jgi:transcriptional regulator with XRE-family HTH domain
MARTALGWGVRELAERADINPNTVVRIEHGHAALGATLHKLENCLQAAGARFVADVDGMVGVKIDPARHGS